MVCPIQKNARHLHQYSNPFDMLEKTIKKISPPTFKPTIYLQKWPRRKKKNPVDHPISSSAHCLEAHPHQLCHLFIQVAAGRGTSGTGGVGEGRRVHQQHVLGAAEISIFLGKKKFKKKKQVGFIETGWLQPSFGSPFHVVLTSKRGNWIKGSLSTEATLGWDGLFGGIMVMSYFNIAAYHW